MPTPAFAIQPAAIHDAPPASRKPESAAPDGSFNQVLSREISARQPADNERNVPSSSSPSSSVSRPEKGQPAEPAAGKATKTEKRPQNGEADGNTAEDAVNETDAAAAGISIPAEMMALIAGAAQVRQPADGETSPAVGTPDTALPLKGDAIAAAPSTDIDLKADGATTAQTAAGTEALLPKGDDSRASDAAAEKSGKRFTDDLRTARKDAGGDGSMKAQPVDDGMAPVEALKSVEAAAPTAPNAAALTTEATLQQMNALHAVHQAAPHADRLSPRVGTPAWDTALSQKVVWMVAGEHQSASLTLNPPDLGPLQVVLNVSNSMASATFIAAQPEVRQAIENALPKLREMMDEAGVQLGQATVNTGMPDQRDAPGEDKHGFRGTASGPAAASPVAETAPARTTVLSSGRGLVDTFV